MPLDVSRSQCREPTLEEREQLTVVKVPALSGFQPRRLRQLAVKQAPRNDTNIDCCHVLRSDIWRLSPQTHVYQGHRLWEEIGHHAPDFPANPAINYDSNYWRNFRISEMGGGEPTINEIIALANPVKLPAPSRLGKYTYASYLVETGIGSEHSNFKRRLIAESHKVAEHYRWLKLQSDIRNPPINRQGNIKPPPGYRHHPAWEPPLIVPIEPEREVAREVRQHPRLWRLSYRKNTPHYQKIQTERRAKSHNPRRVMHSVSLHGGIH